MKRAVIFISLLLFILAVGAYFYISSSENSVTTDPSQINVILVDEKRSIQVAPQELYPEIQETYLANTQSFQGMEIKIGSELLEAPVSGSLLRDPRGERTFENSRMLYRFIEQPGKAIRVEAFINPQESNESREYLVNELIVSTVIQYSDFKQAKSTLESLMRVPEIMNSNYPVRVMVDL